MKSDYPIDFVVPWVDGNDPVWQREFKKHSINDDSSIDKTEARYRDWDIFKYWFRGVEKFAPWVNKVHLITCGHYPEWLNLDHPKLNLVRHEDYMPSEYLPTFSANPIELNMHRIKELSEHFVYFNDDIFLINDVDRKDFFNNGYPNDAANMAVLGDGEFSKMLYNSLVVINRNYKKSEVIKDAPYKWFNMSYGSWLVKNALLLPWPIFTGFQNYHIHQNLLKSNIVDVWEKEFSILDSTSKRKFRSDLDVTQYLFQWWQFANNKFHPISKHEEGIYCALGVTPIDEVEKAIMNKEILSLCLNDVDVQDEFHFLKEKIITALNKKLPKKSSFEI